MDSPSRKKKEGDSGELGRLVDRSAQPCLTTDLNLHILRVNRAFEELIGYSAQELAQLNVADITPMSWQGVGKQAVERVLETGQAVRYEKEYRRKDGQHVAVEIAIDLVQDDDGVPRRYFGFVTDIRERKQAEEDRREQEQHFRAIFDHAVQFVGLLKPDGTLIEANRSALEFVGKKRAEVIGRPFWEGPWWSQSSEIRERLKTAIQAAAHGQTDRFEATHTSPDGRTIIVDFSLTPVFDEHGKVILLIPEGRDITESKLAERAIRESEERFRSLYDEAPVGYHEVDRAGILVGVNLTECEILGYAREEMLGRPVTDFLAPEIRQSVAEEIVERFTNVPQLNPSERIYITRNGQRLIMAIDPRYRFDDQGHVVGIRAAIQDVTERKRTEAALVASERRIRALFNGIEDAIFVHDDEGHILDANPAACRRLGYSREHLLTLKTKDVDDPEFASGYEDRLRRQIELGRLSFEGRHKTSDGRIIPVEVNTSTIMFDNQRAVLAVIRDITERRALEETRQKFAESQLHAAETIEAKNRELTSSEARYRQLTEGTYDAVVVADEQGIITLFNPAAERTFCYAAQEIMGESLAMLMPEAMRSHYDNRLGHYTSIPDFSIIGQTVELQGLRKSGERFPLELSLSAFEAEGRRQYISSIRDQTERQRMRTLLVQSEKLASIGLLSAGVAHEINNPLAFVGNNLAVLERDLKGVFAMMSAYEAGRETLKMNAPEVLNHVDEVSEELDWPYVSANLERLILKTREGVQRVATIVHSLRSLARTSPPKLEPALLRDLISPAVEMIQGRGRRNRIEIVVGDTPSIRLACVSSQISQVILNLLVNAMQALETAHRPDGGKIIVSTEIRDGQIAIAVKDNGSGIAPEHVAKLFDPFFTTKAVGEGTGLGLSISHGIIAGHGGQIDVASEIGRGTTFTVILPMDTTQSNIPTPDHPDHSAGPRPENG